MTEPLAYKQAALTRLRVCVTPFACLLMKTNFKDRRDLPHTSIKHLYSKTSALPEEHASDHLFAIHFKHSITQLHLEDSMKCFTKGQGFNLNLGVGKVERNHAKPHQLHFRLHDPHLLGKSLKRLHHSSCILTIHGCWNPRTSIQKSMISYATEILNRIHIKNQGIHKTWWSL